MALPRLSKAPDFLLKTSQGEDFNLYQVLDKKQVVLFFYPKAFTPGCTTEVCSFRDDYQYFKFKNIELVGISHDDTDIQGKFKDKYKLPYTLLSDPGRKVARQYEALFPLGLMTKRITYFIDRKGNIQGVYDNIFGAEEHLVKVKGQIERLEYSKSERA